MVNIFGVAESRYTTKVQYDFINFRVQKTNQKAKSVRARTYALRYEQVTCRFHTSNQQRHIFLH